MAKRPKRRQSTLPKPDTKPIPEREKPYARALIYTVSIVVTVVLGLIIGRWYDAHSRQVAVSVDSPLWKVVDLPGKGKGVIASRNISASNFIFQIEGSTDQMNSKEL
jgi:hypothetical protein